MTSRGEKLMLVIKKSNWAAVYSTVQTVDNGDRLLFMDKQRARGLHWGGRWG